MKWCFRILFILFIMVFANHNDVLGQRKSRNMRQIERRSRKNEGSLTSGKSRKVIRAEKKADETKERQKDDYDKAKKKDTDHRMSLQSAKSQKMMEETKKDSENDRKKRREPFFKRLFRKNPHDNKN